MTTKKDDNIAPYLLDPKDPHYKKPKQNKIEDNFLDIKLKHNKRKRHNLLKNYLGYMIEVILA